VRFLRVIGLVIAFGGLALLLVSMLGLNQDPNNALATYGLFGLLIGLLLAMAADAGQKMSDRQNAPKADSKKGDGKKKEEEKE
jgi:succinate-acetate transporter protein